MTDKRLVAVRPNATIDYEIKGVIFKIGILPRSIHGEFSDAVTGHDKGNVSSHNFLNAQREVVKWAIKGHENFFYEDGEPVPFITAKSRAVGGVETDIVSDETLDEYYSVGVSTVLALRCYQLEGAGQVKKAKGKKGKGN